MISNPARVKNEFKTSIEVVYLRAVNNDCFNFLIYQSGIEQIQDILGDKERFFPGDQGVDLF